MASAVNTIFIGELPTLLRLFGHGFVCSSSELADSPQRGDRVLGRDTHHNRVRTPGSSDLAARWRGAFLDDAGALWFRSGPLVHLRSGPDVGAVDAGEWTHRLANPVFDWAENVACRQVAAKDIRARSAGCFAVASGPPRIREVWRHHPSSGARGGVNPKPELFGIPRNQCTANSMARETRGIAIIAAAEAAQAGSADRNACVSAP